MHIKWYGHAAFKISGAAGPSVIVDPFNPQVVGYPPIADAADIALISSDDDEGHCRADLLAGAPQVVNALAVARAGGGAEVGGLAVQAVEAAEWELHPEHEIPGACGMYRFALDGVTVAHMGDVGNPLSAEQTQFFAGVDVLLALAGGPPTIALDDLMRLIAAVRPKLVIPMHFRTLTYRPRNSLWIESFLQHFDDRQVDFACASQIEVLPAQLPAPTKVVVMDYAGRP